LDFRPALTAGLFIFSFTRIFWIFPKIPAIPAAAFLQ